MSLRHAAVHCTWPIILGLTLVALCGVSNGMRPLARLIDVRPALAGGESGQLALLAGHGGTLAVLGGMRSLVANGTWLRANLAWEHRDAAETTALIGLTVAADERPLYFWLNGARMMAYDMPGWRLTGIEPAAARRRIDEEQAQQALQFLERGRRWHGADAALYIEMANIHLRRRGDLETAAHYYRLAAGQPDAPYYAARIHAELLRALGRREAALDWLRRVLPRLPADDPEAVRDVVAARIRELERELAGR